MSPRAAIILAAGQGTRMKSTLPKVLHPLAGRTLLDYAIDAATAAGCERIVVVTGLHSPDVGAHVAQRLGAAAVAIQDSPLGTAHAVLAAKDALAGFAGDVVISYADCPLVGGATLQAAFDIVARGADVAVLGFEAQDPGAYGRLVTDGDSLSEIVEAKEASPEQLAIRLCNSGIMAAKAQTLFSLLPQVKANNAKGEYYLTDVVGLARGAGLSVKYAKVAETDVQGVNSQAELAAAEAVYQQALRLKFLKSGVRMPAPETVIFSYDTLIGAGSLIEPYVVFGPGVSIAAGATVRSFSHLEGATVDAEAVIGPYARLRPGAEIGAGAHIGNFVEVKNVAFGAGAKANHLSYLGDGAVGPRTNIGAGVIFCNYDGYDKHRTIIGSDAFIGSNAALVAPVAIGDGALIGSGSVIVSDVPADALALARGRQYVKDGWAADFRAKHKE